MVIEEVKHNWEQCSVIAVAGVIIVAALLEH